MNIRPMTPDEIADYREYTIASVTREKMRAEGISETEARQSAEKSWDRAAPDEGDSDDQQNGEHLMGCLEVDGEKVGVMWFVVRPEWGRPTVWLYDIVIDEAHRGHGLGRKAMELLEHKARERGVDVIGLHVFGHNKVARSLYEKQGFRATSIVMRKDI